MKKLITICAAALVLSAFAADTDVGALITSGNIEDTAKVENLTGANAGKATITINDNSGTANSVTVYNAATIDTALAGKASTGDVTALQTRATALETSTNNLTTAIGGVQSTVSGILDGDTYVPNAAHAGSAGSANHATYLWKESAETGYTYDSLTAALANVAPNYSTVSNKAMTALQSFTETDPTVPSWAKASSKPSYNFSEIGTKPTTLAGYGITDAKIANGTITLGSDSITPLTSYTETDPVWTAAKGLYSTTAQMNSAITAATNGLAKASALTGYVPTSRKVAGMSLTGDITLKSLSIVGASTTTYNGSAAASVNQSTLTEAAKTSGGTSGKTLTLAVASTSRSLGEYYIAIGAEGKPHLMLRQ